MKIIYGTADPKMVMVEIAPEEMRLVYHNGAPDLMFHKAVIERTKRAFEAAEVDGADIIGTDLDMTDAERDTVLAAAVHYTAVPVRRAKAPWWKIWQKSNIALNGL